MFGSLMITLKKIVFGIVLSAVLFLILALAPVPSSALPLCLMALWAGIIFPDLDSLAGFAKGFLQAASILAFLFGVIILFLYPFSMPLAGSFCSDNNMQAKFGLGGLSVFCNIGASLLFLVICYVIAHFVIGLMPETGSFHNIVMAFLVVVSFALLGKTMLSSLSGWLTLASFASGYGMHLLVDGGKKNR